MNTWFAAAVVAFVVQSAPGSASAQASAHARPTLDIYVVDVEGGNATLFVPPSGASLLIDTGNAGPDASVRDASRIVEAARDAGLTEIDTLVTTHWHGDHYGGMAELAKRIPIRHFIDHGANVQPAPGPDEFLAKVYPGLYAKGRHTVVKPGDRIPVAGLDVLVVASAGETIRAALPGAGAANPACAAFKPGENNAEDPMSVGILATFGKFRAAHLGDLTKNKEFELMCPANRVGAVDVLLGLHHGVDTSNSPVLVHALRPRVAIMNNGARKGGQPEVLKTLRASPGFEDVWQMHFSLLSGREYPVPELFIANLLEEPVSEGPACWIKVSARRDGTFTVTNARNHFSKTYTASTPGPR